MTLQSLREALKEIIEEVDEYAKVANRTGLGAYEACANVRKIAKRQLKAIALTVPGETEIEDAKKRLVDHLEIIEGYNEASTPGGLFTQQDQDIITLLRALGEKI